MTGDVLSVVVPVYNVSSYLDTCLGSLAAQTYDNIEILCVNDGSTDDSLDKLREWERRDARVRVVSKPNGGLSSARNAGIRYARGRFVCFLDSDDTFVPSACEQIVSTLSATNADVLTFGATYTPPEAGNPWLDFVLSPRDVTYDGFSMDVLMKEASRPFSWRMAFARDFLIDNDLLFDEDVRFGEDQVFCFAVYPRSRRTVFLSQKLYEYQAWRAGSLMDRMNQDLGAKMSEHVNIARHILADWRGMGLLEAHAPEMISWALDFTMVELFKVPQREFLAVTNELSDVLREFFDEDVAQRLANDADRRLATSLLAGRSRFVLPRKLSARTLYYFRYAKDDVRRWLTTSWYLRA
ncbi:glycosyltransferase family 2 protein [Olsenella massiliensis]|uniref:glycosyltransferase family 2 protein n=1 Tax=Olsenella massiliensis TaxID=1622075 RepID=UPI00071C88C2|nr:glycosyltransferase family 2 protein [Olsenella massiliensis]